MQFITNVYEFFAVRFMAVFTMLLIAFIAIFSPPLAMRILVSSVKEVDARADR